MRDTLPGLFIALENQFDVGDVIDLQTDGGPGRRGTIEALTLRVTSVAPSTAPCSIVPNGIIQVVSNKTRGWARAIVDVRVALDRGPDRGARGARRSLRRAASERAAAALGARGRRACSASSADRHRAGGARRRRDAPGQPARRGAASCASASQRASPSGASRCRPCRARSGRRAAPASASDAGGDGCALAAARYAVGHARLPVRLGGRAAGRARRAFLPGRPRPRDRDLPLALARQAAAARGRGRRRQDRGREDALARCSVAT